MGHNVDVNPAILVWARKRARFDLEEAAEKFGIRKTRLEKIENGVEGTFVSRTLFRKIIKLYRLPSLVFYLSDPPREELHEVEFRRTNQDMSRNEVLVLESLIRNVRARQSIVKAAIESDSDAGAKLFIASLSIEKGVHRGVEILEELIGGPQTITSYHSSTSVRVAFNSIRKRAEESGVFVVLKGNLGSYHTDIPVRIFRGLTISDRIAPFIIINPSDSYPARTFTLLHEMVHLLLGESRIMKESYGDEKVENFCNQVASHCLLPEKTLTALELHGAVDQETLTHAISNFARRMNLSSTMVAYRLFVSQRINRSTFATLRRSFYNMWRLRRDSVVSPENQSGMSYYLVHRSRIGESLVKFTKRMLETEAISTSTAAQILDVRPINLGEMLRNK